MWHLLSLQKQLGSHRVAHRVPRWHDALKINRHPFFSLLFSLSLSLSFCFFLLFLLPLLSSFLCVTYRKTREYAWWGVIESICVYLRTQHILFVCLFVCWYKPRIVKPLGLHPLAALSYPRRSYRQHLNRPETL